MIITASIVAFVCKLALLLSSVMGGKYDKTPESGSEEERQDKEGRCLFDAHLLLFQDYPIALANYVVLQE
jgi:hypothetical protein